MSEIDQDRQIGPVTVGEIRGQAEALSDEVIALRRAFHRNPELGMEEFETAATVAAFLRALGIEVTESVATTGVIGLLRGAQDGPTVALRADMDALPMDEDTGVEYASCVQGKMHSCGHDAHTACLMGTAKALVELTDCGRTLKGNVKFLFQPAEEGPGGAEPMLAEGAFEDPVVDAVFGLHVSVEHAVGTVGSRSGVITAAADEARIEIIGSGGHGAHPHKSVDSVIVAAQALTALQTIVSREVSPADAAVITVGRIEGGYRNNIIAPNVKMETTIRSLSDETRDMLQDRIEGILSGITGAMRADYRLDYQRGYPPLENDREMVDLFFDTASVLLGPSAVLDIPEPSMGAEDFAYFARAVPGCFFRLGVHNAEKGLGVYPNHNPKFDIDEGGLVTGVTVMTGVALAYLSRES